MKYCPWSIAPESHAVEAVLSGTERHLTLIIELVALVDSISQIYFQRQQILSILTWAFMQQNYVTFKLSKNFYAEIYVTFKLSKNFYAADLCYF